VFNQVAHLSMSSVIYAFRLDLGSPSSEKSS
jgi:hypothetical protein